MQLQIANWIYLKTAKPLKKDFVYYYNIINLIHTNLQKFVLKTGSFC